MFPQNALSPSYYELYVNPETRVDLFKAIHTRNIVALRFSGEITVPTGKGAQRRDSGQENLMLMLKPLDLFTSTVNLKDSSNCLLGA